MSDLVKVRSICVPENRGMGIMMSSCDVTACDSGGTEIPAKNTYPYSYSSLHDTLTLISIWPCFDVLHQYAQTRLLDMLQLCAQNGF